MNGAAPDPRPYLDKLAAALDGELFTTCLVAGQDSRAELRVTNRAAPHLAETLGCDGGHYLWSWGRPIAAVDEVQATAQAITYVLRAGQ